MACWIATLYGGPKRSNQAAVAIEHKIYCFGGCRCIHEESSDQIIETFGVHVLNTIDYRWKLVETTAFQPNLSEQLLDGSGKPYQAYGEIPPLRVGHTVVVHQGMVYMWGGCCPDTNMMCSKMYRFDPEQRIWSVIPSASDTPSPRARHTAVVYNDMMLVYGGIESDRTNGRTILRNDVWAYYFKTRKWYDVIVHGEIPPERFQHTACVIDEKMYVYGGIDSARRQLYLDVLNLRKSCWEKLDEGGQKPCGIRAACSWVHDNKMYIFGGYRGEYYITTLHRFDPKTLVWHEMKPFGLSGPIGRERHCAVIVGDCVYVFSGLASVVSLTGNVGFGCLMEMCDLNVLSYNWTLKNLASIAVLRYQLNFMQSVELPVELKSIFIH